MHYEATEFRSGFFKNDAGSFSFEPFPMEVQQSPINSILFNDFDQDGQLDLLLAGNNYMSEIETTRYDAGIGYFLKGIAKGNFQIVDPLESGFFAPKDVRGILLIGSSVFVANNNDKPNLFRLKDRQVVE